MTVNFCSHCGHRLYQHGKDGCQHREVTGHVVKITVDAFVLKHSLSERESDRLFDCTLHYRLHHLLGQVNVPVGEYSVMEDDNGELCFRSPDEARTPCDCKRPHPLMTD